LASAGCAVLAAVIAGPGEHAAGRPVHRGQRGQQTPAVGRAEAA
jgi:hypothetical protein